MQRLKEWAPTQFDHVGLGPDEFQEWYVLPWLKTRDSSAYEDSNYESARAEFPDHETLSFGHWGPGWFEIAVVPDTAENLAKIETMVKRFENYPVIDEDDYSRRESEAAEENWKNWQAHDVARELSRHCMTQDAADVIESFDLWELRARLDVVETVEDCWRFEPLDRDVAARVIRAARKSER